MTRASFSESERRTRESRIDPELEAWGWQIAAFDATRPLSKYAHHAIEAYPTANGPADYTLVVDGQLLGVIEAKKVTLGPQNVLTLIEDCQPGFASGQKEVAGGIRQLRMNKAFRGEPVPAEAQLAEREGRAYESAAVLLDRLSKQRLSPSDGKTSPRMPEVTAMRGASAQRLRGASLTRATG